MSHPCLLISKANTSSAQWNLSAFGTHRDPDTNCTNQTRYANKTKTDMLLFISHCYRQLPNECNKRAPVEMSISGSGEGCEVG